MDAWDLSVLSLHNFLWIYNYFKMENKNLFHVDENLPQVGWRGRGTWSRAELSPR